MSTDDTTPLPGSTPANPGSSRAGAPGAEASVTQAKLRPRTSPIVWGSLILVFCAYLVVREAGGRIDPTVWLISCVLGLGVLLLTVGVVVLVRSPRQRQEPGTPAPNGERS